VPGYPPSGKTERAPLSMIETTSFNWGRAGMYFERFSMRSMIMICSLVAQHNARAEARLADLYSL
jgi:hypothetical protein